MEYRIESLRGDKGKEKKDNFARGYRVVGKGGKG